MVLDKVVSGSLSPAQVLSLCRGAGLPHSLDGMKQSEFLSQIVVCILCYLSVLCIMLF